MTAPDKPTTTQRSEADDLTGLIERIENATHRSNLDEMLLLPALIDAERDTIVLALRVLRVLRVGSPIHAYATASGEVRIDATHPLGCSGSLDDAERLLGIGGE